MLRLFLFCFVLLCFRLYAFVEAAALRLIVLRYAGAPIAARVSFFFSAFVYLEMSLFPSIFVVVPFPLSHCMESTSLVLSFRMMVFFYLVTTGWIFDISLYENSINQSINIKSMDQPGKVANPARGQQNRGE